MESLKRSIRYQLVETKKFLLGFWGTILLVNIAFYIINDIVSNNINIGLSIGTSEGIPPISVVGVNLMAILIALLVYNYGSNYEGFPLALSLSMNRKDYFVSFLIDNVITAFVFAIIQGILLKIDPIFIKLVGRTPIYEYGYFNTKTDPVFFIIFTLFIVFLGFISFWNLIASINYKFGYKIWIIFIGFNILVSILNIDFIGKLFNLIESMLKPRLGVLQVVLIVLGMVLLYTLNYFIVHHTDVKKKLG